MKQLGPREKIMKRVSIRRMRIGSILLASLIFGLGLTVSHADLAKSEHPRNLPVAWVPPPGVVQITPCIPTQGEHWADPDHLVNFPQGPLYTVDKGRLISVEYIFAKQNLVEEKSFHNLKFLYYGRELPIRHMDVDFLVLGDVPVYGLHAYLVTHKEDRAIECQ